jgi:3-deoxy-7-phosphoheptulonate synthase
MWTRESWKGKDQAQGIPYPNVGALEGTLARLKSLPPLVSSGEIDRLHGLLSKAADGQTFLLQGGDCAELFAYCSEVILPESILRLLGDPYSRRVHTLGRH